MRDTGLLHRVLLLGALCAAGCGNNDTFLCAPQCPKGTHCAATGCAPDHPGAGNDLSGAVDMASACMPACSGDTHCNASNHCVPCLIDAHCPIGQICKPSGAVTACVAGCADDSRCAPGGDGGQATMQCCGGQCADTTKDPQNCGKCGGACGVQNSSAQCASGACVPGKCNPGWGDCNNDPKDGCETNLHVDPNNCTACGMKCSYPHASAGCADGCYLGACDFGYADCNNDMNNADGCEQKVSNDPMHCGDCTTRCGGAPNASVDCVNSFCAITKCSVGFLDCNGEAKDGCEVNGTSDAANCGACGKACAQGLVCKGSQCTCPNCNIPNASAKCMNNQCMFDKCNPGYSDCDNNTQNGCEVNTAADPKNCGNCGMVCPQNMVACVNSVCSNSPCIGNPQWQRVTCVTPDWVWSSNSGVAKTVQAAAAARVLETGCMHGQPQPDLGNGVCSLDGKGWVTTKTWVMAGCNNTWWHLGGRFSGQCGGHDGDVYRHLVLTDNDCYPY